MSTIGNDKNPIRLGTKGKVRINSSAYSGESKKKFNDNYDKIFGGSKDVRQRKKES